MIDIRTPNNPMFAGCYGPPSTHDTQCVVYRGPGERFLYARGNRDFEANYTAGLRVLEFGDLPAADIGEIAFFDTYPASESRAFNGAWSVYPYLPSGTLLVNETQNGLFVLTPR